MTHDDAPEPVHDASGDVTRLLAEVGRRDDAWSDLLALVYDELRALAARRMAHERVEHTLQATALVHEAVLRLIGDRGSDWTGRRHFFGAAAEAMRRVLVDHARRCAPRDAAANVRGSLTLVDLPGDADPERVLALDEALTTLEGEDARAAEVARLRWFAGLSVAETALALEVSERTVMREWTFARARLSELLGDTSSE